VSEWQLFVNEEEFLMSRYLFFAFSDCKDPAREDEFNEWYSTMHVPDMLQVPGMISAARWASASDKPNQHRKYLALYELETDDIEKFDANVREATMAAINRGRFSNLPVFDPPEIPRFYRQIMPEKNPENSKK
jgi:hypothetical protein